MAETKKNRLKIPLSNPQTEIEEAVIEEKPRLKAKKTPVGPEKAEKASKSAKQQGPGLMERLRKAKEFYTNERTQKVIGLLSMLLAVYLSVAFVSFIFTWQEDQDKVLGPASVLFSADTKVLNWLGKLGALVSHLFMFKWFGMSSFLLVPVFLLAGLKRLVSREFEFLKKIKRISVFFIFWFSLCFGFFFTDKLLFMGGGFGYILNAKLAGWVGSIGTLALLAVSLFGFLVIMFNFSFERKVKPIGEDTSGEIAEEVFSAEDKNNKFTIPTQETDPVFSKEEEEELLDIKVVEPEEQNAEEKKTMNDFEIVQPV
ncbi:MAG: DNA translocase FtsK 4TM domain-containing protein, partial [Cytophagaceae bacterium]